MKPFKILLFPTLVISTGCAFHSGHYSSNVMLEPGTYHRVGYAMGSASTTHVIGIGGLSKQGLVNAARSNMYSRRPLQPDEELVNISVDIKRGFYFIVWQTTVFVSADVVRIHSHEKSDDRMAITEPIDSSEAIQINSVTERDEYTNEPPFAVDRKVASIWKGRLVYATIEKIGSDNTVFMTDVLGGKFSAKIQDVYITEPKIFGQLSPFLPGSDVRINIEEVRSEGKVIGVGYRGALVSSGNKIVESEYQNITTIY